VNRLIFLVGLLLPFVLAQVVLAQDAPSVTPKVTGNTVPAWVFYWVLGLATFFGAALLTVIKILWDRGNQVSGLSEEERAELKQLFAWHDRRDDDQVPLWYVPRSWLDTFQKLQSDHADVKYLLTKISEQQEVVIADLREQIKESRGLQAQQQTKMLKLAVRVQRAVEALAGLAPPEIESALEDDGPEGE